MDVLEVLRAARAYISDPAMWQTGDYGEDGGPRCMVGACASAAGVKRGAVGELERGPVIAALWRVVGPAYQFPHNFNDNATHADVMAAFDRAIAVEEAKAAEFDTGASHALLAIAERETVAA